MVCVGAPLPASTGVREKLKSKQQKKLNNATTENSREAQARFRASNSIHTSTVANARILPSPRSHNPPPTHSTRSTYPLVILSAAACKIHRLCYTWPAALHTTRLSQAPAVKAALLPCRPIMMRCAPWVKESHSPRPALPATSRAPPSNRLREAPAWQTNSRTSGRLSFAPDDAQSQQTSVNLGQSLGRH